MAGFGLGPHGRAFGSAKDSKARSLVWVWHRLNLCSSPPIWGILGLCTLSLQSRKFVIITWWSWTLSPQSRKFVLIAWWASSPSPQSSSSTFWKLHEDQRTVCWSHLVAWNQCFQIPTWAELWSGMESPRCTHMQMPSFLLTSLDRDIPWLALIFMSNKEWEDLHSPLLLYLFDKENNQR